MDDDVFSDPGSSFFREAFFSSSPQIDSTPPTSDFAGSSHNTPAHSRHRTPVKSLNTPWGLSFEDSFEEQDIKLETTPPPSSQLPAECDQSPTPAPRKRTATPNAVRPLQCCQIKAKVARDLINRSKQDMPLLSDTSDEHAYNQWATIVRNALVQGEMFKFVDGSHAAVHRGTRFYRNAEIKTADLIRDAYTAAAGDCKDPVVLRDTLHMPADDLWDHIRAAHTSIPTATPTPSFFSSINTFSSSAGPSSSSSSSHPSAPPPPPPPPTSLPPSNHFSTTSGRVYFLVQKFNSCTLALFDGNITRFAAQLDTIVHRMAELGYHLPAYMLNMHFLYNLEPKLGPKVKELEKTYGEALWRGEEGGARGGGGGVSFAVVREAVIAEAERLREKEEREQEGEVVDAVLRSLEKEGDGGREMKAEEREWGDQWTREESREAKERAKRADAAERRMRSVEADVESSPSIADEELRRLQEDVQDSVESDEADSSEMEEEEEHESSDEDEQELPARLIAQAEKDSEEEVDEERDEQKVVLQVKDTEDEESDGSSSSSSGEEELEVEPSTGNRRPTTPDQVHRLNGILRVSETPMMRPGTQPQPPSSKTSSSQSVILAKSPARVAQVLGDSARSVSAVPMPSTKPGPSTRPPPAAGPSSSAPPAAAPVRATASSTYVVPRDLNEPYSDIESTAAAVRRARGAKMAAEFNRKQRREAAKMNRQQKTPHEAAAAAATTVADAISGGTVRRRKSAAEANEAFDREYKRSRRLVNVGFTRLPHVNFKIEKKEEEAEKSEGKDEDKEKKKKSKKEEKEKRKKEKREKRKEKKEKKRKQREEDEREVAEVESPSKTLRRSWLAL
ncbi:hypothetical protein SLS58_009634 [Diplodia intermedia]|uniref:Uncharacterized protein n=1 Tax=Diplodia intermedia TaxID=856260 RepID=A0ABR3TB26_9PEZI